MEGVRLCTTQYCRALAQRWRLGASRFSYSVFRFVRLGQSVEFALLLTVQHLFGGGIARLGTPHGCECDLLLVLDLETPTFVIVPFGAQFMVT